MDALRRMLATIGKQLGTLTLTQKALIMALVVVAALALVVVAMSAGRTSMVELMPGVSADQQAKAKSFLDSMNITYRAEGGKLMVPVEQRPAVLAALSESGNLPADSARLLFSNLAASRTWMSTKAQNDTDLNIALMNELESVIGKFRGIQSAKVMLEAPDPIGLGMAYRKPTASVVVFTEPGRGLSRETVEAIAATVAGAKAGLAVTDVKVIDGTTGRQFSARSPQETSASDYFEHATQVEARVQEKLIQQLAYIRGVVVAVNAQVDIRRTDSVETRVLPQGSGSVSIVSRENTKSNVSGAGSGGQGAEPGLRSNVAADVNTGSGAAGGPSSTEESADTEFTVGLGKREDRVVDPRGMPTKINVTINVPREYVAALWKARNAPAGQAATDGSATPAQEPTPQQLEDEFARERTRIQADIAPLVETSMAGESGAAAQPVPGVVTVSMIPVPLNLAVVGSGGVMAAGMGGGGGGGDGMVNALLGSGLIKNVMLGALAVVALGMMMLIVRKAAKPVVLPKPEEIVGLPPALQGTSDVVGEADETQTAMEGIELDDQELRNKKMLESVTEMVKKAPGDAAKLLNRWIVSSEET